MNYPEAVARRILPLSTSSTLKEAFGEWRWTGEAIDHEQCVAECELCGKEDLRYHFFIENVVTHRTMSVGSKCILKFGIAVHDARGRVLERGAAKRKLDEKLAEVRKLACLAALQRLAQTEEHEILSSALAYWRRHGYLSPKQAFIVYWRLHANGIEYNPSFFKIGLRRKKHQADLHAMPTSRVHYIWPGLSPSQRRKAQEMGHAPPP